MRPYLLVPVALVVSSCASPHLYPICYFDESPTRPQLQATMPALQDSLRKALGTSRDVPIAVSPDGRWLVANVTQAENAAAAEVWPRVGCIGEATDSQSVGAEASCVNYVRDFVANKNYFAFGNARDKGGFDIFHESSVSKSAVYCNAVRPGK